MSIPSHRGLEAETVINALVHVECKIMKNVLAAAVETEIGAHFFNYHLAEIIRTTLEKLGHQQEITNIITDILTANNIINGVVKQQCTKAMHMHYN